jgi:hypothetical protein
MVVVPLLRRHHQMVLNLFKKTIQQKILTIQHLVCVKLISIKKTYINLGDVHYYSFFADAWDGDTYPAARFISETGVQSMTSLETWMQITNSSEDFNFEGTLAEYRNHHGNGQQEMMFVSKFDMISFS